MTSNQLVCTVCARTIVCAAGLLIAATAAAGPTLSLWSNPAGGMWSDGANWSTNPDFPNNNGIQYEALIDTLLGAYTVDLDLDIVLTDFTLRSSEPTLNLGAFELDILGAYLQEGAMLIGPGAGQGTLRLGGDAELRDVSWMSIGQVMSEGTLTFNSTLCDDICDTPILHTGSAVQWNGTGDIFFGGGSSLTLSAASTFSITNDRTLFWDGLGAQPALNIQGALIKSTGSGITFIDGVELNNTGMVMVETGTLRTNGVDVAGAGGALVGGAWTILDNAELDLLGEVILTNEADVTLIGPNARFDALELNLQTNGALGRLTIDGGRVFQTSTDFQNDGELTIGAGAMVDIAPGSTLLNVTGNELSGGVFTLAGALRYDNADIRTVNTVLMLDGPGSAILDQMNANALAQLAEIGDLGELSLLSGRSFTTSEDFRVMTDGLLSIDVDSTFEVAPGFVLENFLGGVFTDGRFDVRGTLRFPNADVNTIENRIILDGPGSLIVDSNDLDGFRNLSLIGPDGTLTLRNGRGLDVLGDLTIQGQLIIESPPDRSLRGEPAPNSSVSIAGALDLSSGALNLAGGLLTVNNGLTIGHSATLAGAGEIRADVLARGAIAPGIDDADQRGELFIDGDLTLTNSASLRILLGGDEAGVSHDFVRLSGSLLFGETELRGGAGAATLIIDLLDGFTPAYGQSFLIMTYMSRDGVFGAYEGLALGGGLTLTPVYGDASLSLVVTPAPSTGASLAAFLSLAARRRRSPAS